MISDLPARREHWQTVYATKDPAQVSWFQDEPKPSLDLIGATSLAAGARVIDVGGGASSLVDHLLDRGFQPTVLDLADSALDQARRRLGDRATEVEWICADASDWIPPEPFDLWHDRAVFHFLTEPEQRAGYRRGLTAGLKPQGFLIMATFAPDGPERCSGLPVMRWSAGDLAAEFADDFTLIRSDQQAHTTPGGSTQAFTWTLFRRR